MLKTLGLFSLCMIMASAAGQSPAIDEIMTAMSQDKIPHARALAEAQMSAFRNDQELDSLAQYVYVMGLIERRENDSSETPESDALYEEMIFTLTQPLSKHEAAIGRTKLDIDRGAITSATEAASLARNWAIESGNLEARIAAELYSSDCCFKRGEIACLESHIRAAKKLIESEPEVQFSLSPRVWNLMAVTMYFKSIPDSAIYYWEKAIHDVKLLPDLPENKYYLPAMFKGNLSLVRSNQGEFTIASELIEESLSLYKTFMRNTKNHPLEGTVLKGIGLAYNNLTGLYHNVGDYYQSNAIAKVQYKHAKKYLDPCDQEYLTAILGLSDTHAALSDLDIAMQYLSEAESILNTCEEENINSLAMVQQTLGGLHFRLQEIEPAISAYQKADSLYEISFPGEYNWNRFYAVMNLSILLSEGGYKEEAIAMATDLYDRFNNSEDGNDFFASSFLLTLARINLDQGEYADCIRWANIGMESYEGKEATELVSSVLYETEKAKLITLRSRAKYAAQSRKDQNFLIKMLEEMELAMQVVETRKSVLNSTESVNNLMEQNKEVFDFVKKLYLDLYELTAQEEYLRKLVTLHESAIYGRIRSRLNTKNTLSIAGVPKPVMKREHALRKLLNDNLDDENIVDFNKHAAMWRTFLDSVKLEYPRYYEMRYANIEEPVDDVMSKIPAATTVVRYIVMEGMTYALVLTNEIEQLLPLTYSEDAELIERLNDALFDHNKSAEILHQLYKELWAPIEDLVHTENVVIIPDGSLYNLSFESLLTSPPTGSGSPWKNALLYKHFISYNFSLLLLSDTDEDNEVYDELAFFVPEFNDEMKAAYRSANTDSTEFEDGYLSLLSQPFAFSFARKLSERFNGESYLNSTCTEQNFVENAGGKQVIFIGTHAESDNVNPEMSRFIFAKNKQEEDNSLYSYEIYNCDLRSELAVLTACETAKPSYQPGEGMVSLAHAFNYAGSKSLLTSLWKIDEQTSIEQVNTFYEYLTQGHPKHVALTLAKRDYLNQETKGRLAPGYWSGMILMGDVTPVELTSNSSGLAKWVIVMVLLILLALFLFLRRFRKSAD